MIAPYALYEFKAMRVHKPFDRNGQPIKVGDLVRIIGVPDLSGMSPGGVAESLPTFQYLVGKYKRVRNFDEYGCAEFSFVIRQRNGEHAWHSVWIEPCLLHVPQGRTNPVIKQDAPKKIATDVRYR